MNRAMLLLLIALLALPAATACGQPSQANSYVPAWMRALTPQLPSAPEDVFTVVVRDEAAQPIAGCPVIIDFSGCSHVRLASEQRMPSDVLVDCSADTLRAFTDASGTVNFVLYGAVLDREPAIPDLDCIAVYAGAPRVFLGTSSVNAYDLDGYNGLTANDLSLLLCDFGGGVSYARTDYNHVGGTTAADVSLWAARYLGARGNGRSAGRCDSLAPLTPQREAPAQSLRLAWNACDIDLGTHLQTFSCLNSSGADHLVASFVAPDNVDAMTGFDAEIWVVGNAGAPIPSYWRIDPSGCRGGVIFPETSYLTCQPFGPEGWTQIQQAEYFPSAEIPNVVVIRVSGALTTPVALSAGEEYALFGLRFTHTGAPTACPGCSEPVAFMLDWVYLRQSGVAGIGCALPNPLDPRPDFLLRQGPQSYAYWQGVPSGSVPIGVGPGPAGPAALRLAVDNPARSSARITLEVPEPARCRLALYDVAGRSRRLLLEGTLPAGSRTVLFDGRDQDGVLLSSGWYSLRLSAEGRSVTRPLIWLR